MTGYRERCLAEKGESCTICGADENIVVHHIDGDRDNNSLDNLVPVCYSHHTRIHMSNGELSEYTEQLPDEAVVDPSERQPRPSHKPKDKGAEEMKNDPLVVGFGDTPKTRILAVLFDAAPQGLNPTSIADNAAIGRSTWYNNRDDLLETGLVEVDEDASKQAGHSTIYRVAAGDRGEWLGKLRDHTGAALRAELEDRADAQS